MSRRDDQRLADILAAAAAIADHMTRGAGMRNHPPEFRKRAIELARAGTIAVLAKGLRISESCLQHWIKRSSPSCARTNGTSNWKMRSSPHTAISPVDPG